METEQNEPQADQVQQDTQQVLGQIPLPNNFIVGTDTPKHKKTALVVAVIVIFALLGVGLYAFISKSSNANITKNEPDASSNEPKLETQTTIADSQDSQDPQIEGIMNSSTAKTIQAAAEAFYAGGSSGSVQQSENSYFPSQADIKNEEWTTKNLDLSSSTKSAIAKGSVVYKAEGCDNTKPSSKINACKGFTITFKGSSGEAEELKNRI